MTKTFSVDNNNDLFIDSNGNLAISIDEDAVLLSCQHIAKAQRGEMIYQITRGIPNFQTIWNGKPNLLQFDGALRQALLSVDGVTQIISLNLSITNDVLNYTVVIQTIYGVSTLNGQL